MPKNVYIHIPFCRQKCKYCSFISFTDIKKKEEYLDALSCEIKHFYKGEVLDTLYFGGGTPSVLATQDFRDLIRHFNITDKTEITAELNPENLSEQYLAELRKTGINRISMGCQTFDNSILQLIGRRHCSEDVKTAVKLAQEAGFENISLDFIYGLPNQNCESFVKDLETAKSLGVQHISLYGLKIDEGCYFYNNPPQNIADEDIQAEMYLKAIDTLKELGHYEVSNFGKPSRHNLNYWDNNNYYGFGVAAHGYIENIRYSNKTNIDEYISNPLGHDSSTKLTQQEQLEEAVFLGLRKLEGINIDKINKIYGIDFENKYKDILLKYKDYFIKNEQFYSLNLDGILISNSIMSEFLQ